MMPTMVDKPPGNGDWSTEVKFDACRLSDRRLSVITTV
jgi:hypothetical protein